MILGCGGGVKEGSDATVEETFAPSSDILVEDALGLDERGIDDTPMPDLQDSPDIESSETPDVNVPDGVTEPDTPVECNCPPAMHCDESGECVLDVCTQAATTCSSPTEQQVCNDEGSDFEIVPCPEQTVCYLGECVPQACSPDDAPVCEDGQLKTCNGSGTDWNLIPCPLGSLCKNGKCAPVQPNVIFIVDTSGSMNWVNWESETLDQCEGDDCAPWTWPECDDSAIPQTRLGQAKKALQAVIDSEPGAAARLALQRFPQQLDLFSMLSEEKSQPSCWGTPLWGLDKSSADNNEVHQTHKMTLESVQGSLVAQTMPVPFGPETEGTGQVVMDWIDFANTFEPTGVPCEVLYDCETPLTGKACVDGACALVDNPELRAMGKTPLGRSLFYAGEVLRLLVVVEGQECGTDEDCGSLHYACVDGKCHDSMRSCRSNIIVLFTDGGESLDQDVEKFFNPQVQAKRLHYGAGCSEDGDCLNDAVCSAGVCQAEIEGLPSKVCHLTNIACTETAECVEYKYSCSGGNSTCSGKCVETGAVFVDPKGQDVLRDANGTPISVTVHVVDASDAPTGNSLIAALGGGQHVPVDFGDIEAVVEGTLPLLDSKDLTACE